MAAKGDTGTFSRGANSGLVPLGMVYDCAKFHAFMTKCTIVSPICLTISRPTYSANHRPHYMLG